MDLAFIQSDGLSDWLKAVATIKLKIQTVSILDSSIYTSRNIFNTMKPMPFLLLVNVRDYLKENKQCLINIQITDV